MPKPQPIIPRPPAKPIRFLKRKPRPLTTVVAIDSRDGLIMASDLRATSTVIEFASKIRPIRPNELIGCAGTAEYIDIFYRYVARSLTSEARPTDYLQLLNNAVDEYGEYIDDRIDKLGMESLPEFDRHQCYPQGILAVDDGSTRKRIFQIQTPHPCGEIPQFQHRLCVGSGGEAATILLRVLENIMLTWEVDHQALTWTHFSWRTVGQFCTILLRRISEIDPYSRGKDIELLHGQGNRTVNYNELFESPKITEQLTEFGLSVVKEVGSVKLLDYLNNPETNFKRVLEALGLG